jgi:hypothetical protein
MIDIKHKRCEHPGCETRPSRGLPGHFATHCAKHIQEGQIPHPRNKCTHPLCKEQAIYTNKGDGSRPLRCEEHKLEDDINCVERKCVSCGILNILDPTGKCYACDPNKYNTFRLAKQNAVINFLSHKEDIPKPTSCDTIAFDSECELKVRPDMLYDMGTHCVIIEIDENQHKGNPELCECTRMVNIAEALMKPTFFIRYNPDDYKINGRKQTISDNSRREVLAEHLKFSLKYDPETIESYMKEGSVFIKQLFYDDYNPMNYDWTTIHK